MTITMFKSIEFKNDHLILLDQTKLPLEEEYIETDNYERISTAIERLEVRGAPAIGVAAAYAVALAFKNLNENYESEFEKVYSRLASTRPTAVNLFWALDEMRSHFGKIKSSKNLYNELLKKSIEIHNDDIEKCDKIARHGMQIFKNKSVVLTHCNTGQLATGGAGTAFGIIKSAHQKGLIEHVFADETRPLLQGSRLTAFELEKAGVPFSINTDSTAAFLMQQKKIDLIITGADRIASNGDSANKIGTYSLAVLAHHHKMPFYIAAPTSTIDYNCATGSEIDIEFRSSEEVTMIKDLRIAKENYQVFSPAFDVTPAELITGIITEKKLYNYPYKF